MPTPEQSLWQALASAISEKETDLKDYNDEEILTQADLHGVSQPADSQRQKVEFQMHPIRVTLCCQLCISEEPVPMQNLYKS